MVMRLPDLAATERLARDVVLRSRPGDLLVLTGQLGAGKTTLTQAIARQLGSTATVTSPTYTLVHEYPTPEGVLVHIDAYRLADAADAQRLGLDDYLERSRLTVVEWGAGLLALYPGALWLDLSLHEDRALDATAATDLSSADDDAVVRAAPGRAARWRDPRDAPASPATDTATGTSTDAATDPRP